MSRCTIIQRSFIVFAFFLSGCTYAGGIFHRRSEQNASQETSPEPDTLQVTASAYTSHPDETVGNPHLTACGTILTPRRHVIAVSRDLERMGFHCGTTVYIKELRQNFIVEDRMHSRWKKKIDIYMGNDRNRARHWGKRNVTIVKK